MNIFIKIILLTGVLLLSVCGFANAETVSIMLENISNANILSKKLDEYDSFIFQNVFHDVKDGLFFRIETTYMENKNGNISICAYYAPSGEIVVYKDGFGYKSYNNEILLKEIYLMDTYDENVTSFLKESSLIEFGSNEKNVRIEKNGDKLKFHVEFLLKDVMEYIELNSRWEIPEDTVIKEEGNVFAENLNIINIRDFYINSNGHEITLLSSMLEYSPENFLYPDFVEYLANPSEYNEVTLKHCRDGNEFWSRNYKIAKDSAFYIYLNEGYTIYTDVNCTILYEYDPLKNDITLYIGEVK